jgi:hypothetical protein
LCVTYEATGGLGFINWTDCEGNPAEYEYAGGPAYTFCALENTVTFDDGINITLISLSCSEPPPCVSGQLIINNNSSGSEITEIYSTPNTWIIATSVPVGPGSIDIGAQGGTNNPISVEIGDFSSLDNPSCLLMYVNSVLIESQSVTSSGIYTFTPYSISNSDCVWFIFNQGNCS